MRARYVPILFMSLITAALPVSAEAAPTIEQLKEKATSGDAGAQAALAVKFREGQGVEADLGQAMHWAHLSAGQGNAAGMEFVGHAYWQGSGVRRKLPIAFGYFQAAAAENSANATYNLGQLYFAAQGCAHDVPKALAAWEKAAALGHGRAAASAAMAYLSGEGVPPDPAKARQLAEISAKADDNSGLVLLGELHFQAGEIEEARACWTKVAARQPKKAPGQPSQPSAEMAAQQAADLIQLIELRRRAPEPGRFALVKLPHVHQGYNNCGSTSCAMVARWQGVDLGGWGFKKLCPSPLGTGTDWEDLVNAAKDVKLPWRLVTFTADEEGFRQGEVFLRSELDAGRPVIIDFKYYGPQYPNGEAGHTLNLVGYLAEEDTYIFCNPAIPTPGLHLLTREQFEKYWRSNYYSRTAKGVMSRPVIAVGS